MRNSGTLLTLTDFLYLVSHSASNTIYRFIFHYKDGEDEIINCTQKEMRQYIKDGVYMPDWGIEELDFNDYTVYVYVA